jgi:hypothetical protein
MASNDLHLDLELATMQSIATALARLDAAARARTLVWLRLRFDVDIVSAPPTAAPDAVPTTVPALQIVSNPTRVAVYDDALSVDTLGDLFDCGDANPPAQLFDYNDATPQAAAAAAAAPPVTGLLSQLAAGFQELARDWGNACSTPAEATTAPGPLSAAS